MYTSLSFVIFHHHGIHVEKIQRVYRYRVVIDWSMSIYVYYILSYLDGIWAQWIGAVHPWPTRDFVPDSGFKMHRRCLSLQTSWEPPSRALWAKNPLESIALWRQTSARTSKNRTYSCTRQLYLLERKITCLILRFRAWHYHSILATVHIPHISSKGAWASFQRLRWLQRWTSRSFVWHRMT